MTSKKSKSLFFTFLKIGSACISYLHIFIVAKVIEKNSLGLYYEFFNYILLLGVAFVFGFNTILAKKISSAKIIEDVKKTYSIMLVSPLIVLSLACFVYYFYNDGMVITYKSYFISVFQIFGAVLAASTAGITLGAIQGFNKIKTYIFLQSFLPFLPVIIYSLIYYNDAIKPLDNVVNLLIFGYVLSAIAGIYVTRNIIKFSLKFENVKLFLKEIKIAKDFYFIQLSQVIMFTGAALVAATKLHPSDFAEFTIFSRLSALVGFIAIATNIAITPEISKLYSLKKDKELKGVLREQTVINSIGGAIVFSSIMIFANDFLTLINFDVESLYPLFILSFVQLVIIFLGPVAPIMTMLDLERKYMIINLISTPFAVYAIFIFSKNYGLTGACLTIAFTMLIQNFICYYFIRKKFKRMAQND